MADMFVIHKLPFTDSILTAVITGLRAVGSRLS